MLENTNNGYIKIKYLSKVFHLGNQDFPALKDITLDFHQGEFTSVVGRSGSGKSTLMNMITGIDKPTRGEVVIHGVPIHNLSETDMAKWRGSNLGIVFQFYQLIPVLTLLENILLPMQILNKIPAKDQVERAHYLLNLVELGHLADKRPHQVSGGQQQSTAIARAMANDPPILIADEPTGNLGSAAADQIFHIFETLNEQNKTIIMVTHDQELADRAQRVLSLKDGRLMPENHNGKKPSTALNTTVITDSSRKGEPINAPNL